MTKLHSFSIKNIFYDKMDLRLFFEYLHIFGWVGRNFFLSLFFNFTSKLVMFLLYLNSCKIYLFKVAAYCLMNKKNSSKKIFFERENKLRHPMCVLHSFSI